MGWFRHRLVVGSAVRIADSAGSLLVAVAVATAAVGKRGRRPGKWGTERRMSADSAVGTSFGAAVGLEKKEN